MEIIEKKKATIITFGIQKGGSSKTTTVAITGRILASKKYNVLFVDMDSQGNLTELITGNSVDRYEGKTVLEAMKDQSVEGYYHDTEYSNEEDIGRTKIVTADDLLSTFPHYVYRRAYIDKNLQGIEAGKLLSIALEPIIYDWDFILIDTPPALGELTINALSASDYVVPLFVPDQFCFSALSRFFDTINYVKELNSKLKVLGILRSTFDMRRSDNLAFLRAVEKEYEMLTFETIIKRKATTGRISLYGLTKDNKELSQAMDEFIPYVDEFIKRIDGKKVKEEDK